MFNTLNQLEYLIHTTLECFIHVLQLKVIYIHTTLECYNNIHSTLACNLHKLHLNVRYTLHLNVNINTLHLNVDRQTLQLITFVCMMFDITQANCIKY